jgi:hypothetical protein
MGTNKCARKGVDETMRHVPAQENSLPTVNIARIYAGVRAAEVRVKPAQPTEIKDKKIILEVIEQIRKPIPASVYRRHKKNAEYIDKFFK